MTLCSKCQKNPAEKNGLCTACNEEDEPWIEEGMEKEDD